MTAAGGGGAGAARSLSRFRGCLAGALLGDCVGAIYEAHDTVSLTSVLSHVQSLEPDPGTPGSARTGGRGGRTWSQRGSRVLRHRGVSVRTRVRVGTRLSSGVLRRRAASMTRWRLGLSVPRPTPPSRVSPRTCANLAWRRAPAVRLTWCVKSPATVGEGQFPPPVPPGSPRPRLQLPLSGSGSLWSLARHSCPAQAFACAVPCLEGSPPGSQPGCQL
jgi:hypothetical protein